MMVSLLFGDIGAYGRCDFEQEAPPQMTAAASFNCAPRGSAALICVVRGGFCEIKRRMIPSLMSLNGGMERERLA